LPQAEGADVMHAIGVDATWLRTRTDLTGGITIVRELNRDFLRDATNVNLSIGARAHW
jgi:hypothetical protein